MSQLHKRFCKEQIKEFFKFMTLMFAAKRGHKEIVEILFKTGVNPDIQTKYARIDLMFAALNEHKKIADMLKEAGAKQ
ncbi:MAG: ankyrin repeat domain-containing protein [Elusimicrobiota bacterium]|jgi:ankyrin repeat protein|nr:ankyrin repeat domain-containing protein [Elusimicrobiota bacterium]